MCQGSAVSCRRHPPDSTPPAGITHAFPFPPLPPPLPYQVDTSRPSPPVPSGHVSSLPRTGGDYACAPQRPTAASQRSRGGAPCRGAGVACSEPCTDAPETETCPRHEATGHEATGHEATPESDGPAWGAGAGAGRWARGAGRARGGRASDWIIDIVWKTTDWLCLVRGEGRDVSA